MTPKEKAQELVDKFSANVEKETINGYSEELELENAKDSALICIDEVLDTIPCLDECKNLYVFWCEVKQEIEKL